MKNPTLLFSYDNSDVYNLITEPKDIINTIKSKIDIKNNRDKLDELKEYLRSRNTNYSFLFDISYDMYFVITNLNKKDYEQIL